MKKVVVAACAMSVISIPAFAQSSVTLYGLVDTSLSYTNNVNGGAAFQETSGKTSGSRWGLRGSEDLGGGMRAVFTLENGFTGTNGLAGQGNRLFGRQAFVGLASDSIGTFTFGRQYSPISDELCNYFAACFFSPTMHIGDNDNMNQTIRINNSVKFQSNNYAGFTFNGLYGFSNQAAGPSSQGFGNNRAWSIAGNYTRNAFSAGIGYLEFNHPNATSNTSGAVGGASPSSGDEYSSNFFYGIDGGVARQRIGAAGTSYQYGKATADLGFTRVWLDYNDGAARKLNNYTATLRYQLTPPLTLLADYTFTSGSATGLPGTNNADLKPKWHQVTLSADYFLSKRTDLYVAMEYQLAAGDGTTLVGGHYERIAQIKSVGTSSSSDKQLSATVGIRHRF
ncbi:porin [Paraburkholderia fungorum]|uniref:porin n=1 Tax=Paraburkholderia fungorum TaxID=134537 RepID=UPI0038B93D46